MVIYGEYLFVENFIVGGLLLALTGKLTGRIPSWKRLLAGAALCGVSSFIIFLPLTGALSTAVRLGAGIVTSAAAFGRHELLRKSVLLLILTFLSGGAVMALLLWQQEPAITHQGIIYIDAITYFKLICFGILAFGLTYWFVALIRRKNKDIAIRGKVSMVIDDQNYDFNGYVDSGNSLREPVTGKPVVLLDKKGAEKLPFKPSELWDRYAVIPYRTVGVECGYLESVRSDKIIFDKKISEGAFIAFYDGNFGDFEALINKDFLEGGLLEDV